CGNRAFHIGGATPIKFAVANHWNERITRPLLHRPGRHHVRVSCEDKRWSVWLMAAAYRPQIVHVKSLRAAVETLALEARRSQPGGDQVQATGVVRSNRRS